MEYIKAHTKPEDGKLVVVGHSMGIEKARIKQFL